MTGYWLIKSEPSVYAWERLVKEGGARWDGVRNHQAAASLKAMKKGDCAFFYHSNEGLAIVGIATVAKTAYADPSDKTGKFVAVDVAPFKALAKPVSLSAIKNDPALKNMALVRQSRLSVSPVAPDEWQRILELAKI